MIWIHRDHPRLRGEYGKWIRGDRMKLGSPPLARGILSNIGAYAVGTGITPACAGNTSSFVSTARMLGDHPRLRGEYSDKILGSSPSVGSPPLARGIL